MPFQSTMNTDEKNRVKSVLSQNNKILMATVARIYYAHPDPNTWAFSGEQGGLAFVKDKNNGLYYFRLVDLQGTRGILWEHELYEGFVLNEDRPFFHSFAGDDCMIGLVYTDESEAASFMKVVAKKRSALGKAKATAAKKRSSTKNNNSSKGGVDKSLISGPQAGSFRHISHMGYDADKGFTSDNVDPSWMAFLTQLQDHGVDSTLIQENMGFIKDFVRDAQAPKSKSSGPSTPSKKKSEKPPVPSTTKNKKNEKPPPPVPRRGHGQSDSVNSISTPTIETPSKPIAAPPAPPPPPARAALATSAPVPPPPPPAVARPSILARPNGAPAAPPPPPPPQAPIAPPVAAAGAPPPPPPPPAMGGPPPPPPAPPVISPAVSSGGGGGDGRSALLQSIQGKGIHALKKTEGPRESATPGLGRVAGEPATPSPAPRSPPPAEDAGASGGGGGGDLAAALAAALTQRNKKLGDSDDEDDEEEWD